MKLAYHTPGGDLMITADQYVVDVNSGDFTVLRPKVSDMTGQVLFAAKRIDGQGLPIIRESSHRAIVTIQDAEGNLRRLPNGKLEILGYFPQNEQPPSEIPYSVTLNRGRLTYVDLGDPEKFVQVANLSSVQVDGSGQKWLASGRVSLEKVGDINMSAQMLPKQGIWFRGETGGLELADAYHAFRRTPDGRKVETLQVLDAKRLAIKGPFELFIPSSAQARLQAKVQAEAQGFRYKDEFTADSLRFDGNVTAVGARGRMDASSPGWDANYVGLVTWDNGTRLSGDVKANATGLAALPASLQKRVPKDLRVQGPLNYQGALAYEPETGVRTSGRASAGALVAYDEKIVDPQADLSYQRDKLSLVTRRGTWRGSKIEGALAFDQKAKTLQGNLEVRDIDMANLARRAGIRRFTGRGNLVVVVEGSPDNPTAYLRADTESTYSWRGDLAPTQGQIHLVAAIKNKKIEIQQGYLTSSAGNVAVSGGYDLDTKRLALTATGSGIDLYRIDPNLEGIGRFKAKVTGTLDRPRYIGNAELFGLRVQDKLIPIVTTDFTGDQTKIVAENLRAIKGASQAEGRLAVTFKNQALNGSFQALGVQLSDFMGDDYLASISLPDARLAGTLGNPIFSSTATATDIVIKGGKIDSAETLITYQKGLLQVDDFHAKVGAGAVEGYLNYNVNEKNGQANFTAANIQLGEFVPKDVQFSLTGLFSGEAGLTFNEKGLKLGSGEGRLTEVEVNATKFGDGTWQVSGNGDTFGGSLLIGVFERSIELTNLSYRPSTKEIKGDLLARNLELGNLYKVAKPYMGQNNNSLTDLIERTAADVGLAATLGGTLENPNLYDAVFSMDQIKLGAREGGSLLANFKRENKLWTVDSLQWKDGPGLFDFHGTVQESGSVEVSGSINNLDVNYASYLDPTLADLHGYLSFPLMEVRGRTDSPVISASVNTVVGPKETEPPGLFVGPIDHPPASRLNFNLFPIVISESNPDGGGGISFEGDMNFAGYAARLTGSLPLNYPFQIPDDLPIEAQLEVTQRPIGDVDQLASIFDPKISQGNVGGKVTIAGLKNNLAVTGNLTLDAKRLALANNGAKFDDVSINALLDKDPQSPASLLRLVASGTSEAGGSFGADVQSKLPRFADLFSHLIRGETEDIMASDVTGQVIAKALAAKIAVGEDGSAAGVVDGTLQVGGTLAEPTIKGALALANGLVAMPSAIKDNPTQLVPLYSPRFDITLATTGTAKFKSSTADLDLSGQGTIEGTLNDLEVNANLRVRKGLLRLPTSRVTIEPGGTIHPLYVNRDGLSAASIDVSLEGKTRVVSAQFGGTAQRYEVTLGVRGDLLKDGGLALTARSDPPELSQDQILALLGQVSLIEGIASGVQEGNPESQIRNALFGIAVPYLLDPFTSRIASAIGLDYLTLDINALEGATVSFARTLSRDFVIQGSRQVSQIRSGLPVKYDLRLAYQIRLGSRGNRKRLSFSLGTDEIRPWKLGLEYTFRF